MKIVVIGGTGLIGSKVVTRLVDEGHDVVAGAPSSGVNTLTGEGLADAMRDASVVVDVSNSPSFEDQAVLEFFETSTTNQLSAEVEAGVGHHVALSVVGTQRLGESGYFRAKIAQEELIAGSPIPYTIVHATQFFEFLPGLADLQADGDVVRVPSGLFQPMAADDVADAVARAAQQPPANRVVEVGGPETYRMDELLRRDLESRGDARKVVADPNAGYSGARIAERTLLPSADAALGATRYDDWAATRRGGRS
jgi:uncharacterized protein YbjT (DUF2867 family)